MARKGGKRARVLEGEEKRQVRTIRATDTTWNRIMQEAELNGYSVGDLLEEAVKKKIERPPQGNTLVNGMLTSSDSSSHQDSVEELKSAIALLKKDVAYERRRADDAVLDGLRAATLLKKGLKVPANTGGEIKKFIREALKLIDDI